MATIVDGSASFDPKSIISLDPYLEPFVPALEERYKTFKGWKNTIVQHEGGYDKFTKGYERLGFTVGEDGTVVYREWAPGADEAVLIGEFSQCWRSTVLSLVSNAFYRRLEQDLPSAR
jgi:1,4-alpha-glucan branching enzyme